MTTYQGPRPGLNQIPMDELEDGRIYKVRSRNLVIGVWRASTRGFIGIREKFGSRYLFEEFHYDNGPPFGTAWAVAASNITTTVPEKYWDAAKGDDLRNLLMPLYFDILEEQQREWEIEKEKAKALAYRPQTFAEHKREVAIEGVRAWKREAAAAVPEGEERAAALKKIHPEYVERLTAAMKENPVD